MTTLVIGAAGFVGLNLVEALLKRGEAVRAFDLTPLPSSAERHLRLLPGALEVVTGDVGDAARVREVADGATVIVYGAAVTADAARDASAPELVLAVNLQGLLNALRVARTARVRRLVNLSSVSAFGGAALKHDVLTEETPADPESLYSLTKFASERLVRRMAALWDLDAVSVRLSTVFGPWERQTSVRDTPSPPYQVMRAAMEGRPAILERPGVRDWIYAPDTAEAVLAIAGAERLSHSLYHVSTGVPWSLLDWGRRFEERFDGFRCRLAQPGETPTVDLFAPRDRGRLDVSRIIADTGFVPAFDEGSSADHYALWMRGVGTDYVAD